MVQYRKLPVVIDAVQWSGSNEAEVSDFVGTSVLFVERNGVLIPTLEGAMRADVGDWIIRGVAGEHYPCKAAIFEATYARVVETAAYNVEDCDHGHAFDVHKAGWGTLAHCEDRDSADELVRALTAAPVVELDKEQQDVG